MQRPNHSCPGTFVLPAGQLQQASCSHDLCGVSLSTAKDSSTRIWPIQSQADHLSGDDDAVKMRGGTRTSAGQQPAVLLEFPLSVVQRANLQQKAYMHACTHTHTHTPTPTPTNAHAHTHARTHARTPLHRNAYTNMHAYYVRTTRQTGRQSGITRHASVNAHINNAYRNTSMCTCIPTCVRTYTHTEIYIYIYICISADPAGRRPEVVFRALDCYVGT